jgi:Zn-dependent protease with chaperone function
MDFFARQDTARKNTGKLVVLYTMAVIGVVVSLNLIALVILLAGGSKQANSVDAIARPESIGVFGLVSVAGLVLMGVCMFYKMSTLGGDGGKLAEQMGGKLIAPLTSDDEERKLLNVVEEMSIASGVPVPRVYLLPEESINAFAAGLRPDNAVIGVTRGCVRKLSRDELQGVIAHEFSHILNGDMRLNLRMIGWNFGIMAIGVIGYYILRFAPRSSSSSKKEGAGAAAAIAIIGLVMMIVGHVGYLFGQIIQAAVSRQREYLADASAVQFTRNPNGIAGALKKIAGVGGSRVESVHAAEAAHLFFAAPVGGFLQRLFATHPPLLDRISRIDSSFNADAVQQALSAPTSRAPASRAPAPRESAYPGSNQIQASMGLAPQQLPVNDLSTEQFDGRAGPIEQPTVHKQPSEVVEMAGTTQPESIARSQEVLGAIPPILQSAARDAFTARAAVLSLVVGKDMMLAGAQLEAVAQIDVPTAQLMSRYVPVAVLLPSALRLPLLDLCTPALRTMTPTQLGVFGQMARVVGEADRIVSPFELALYKTIDHQLLRDLNPPTMKYRSIRAVGQSVVAVLAALAERTNFDTERAYASGLTVLAAEGLPSPRWGINLREFAAALSVLREATPAVKKRVVEAAAHTVACDRQLNVDEAELLRAIFASLDVPVPLIVEG